MGISQESRDAAKIATGNKIATSDLGAATLTDVHQFTSSKALVDVVITNRNATAAVVKLGHVEDGTKADVANTDYILFDYSLPGNSTYILGELKLDKLDSIIAESDSANVHVVVYAGEA
jgi:hypothetical protein